jgi:DNA-binding CsgD family transcriptional regulator
MFADFLDDLNAAAESGSEIAAWAEAMNDLGFDKHMYGVRARDADRVNEHLVESSSYTDEWLKAYYGGLHTHDPVVAYSTVYSLPFTWADCPVETRDQKRFMSEASDAGMKHGISAPLITGGGYEGAVSVASDTNADLEEHMMAVYAMTSAMHVLRVRNWSRDTLKAFKLTAREQEVMRWIAAGKDDWTISCILGISESGVHFHKKNIFRKLQLTSRVEVASVAQKTGIAEANYRFW